MYDLIIIGAGPAGLTAAIYAARRTLKTLVLGREIGGQAIYASQIENYPGFEKISGFELMDKMKRQAERLGAEFQSVEVKEIEKVADSQNSSRVAINSNPTAINFRVKDKDSHVFEARALILCFGAVPQRLDVPGEEKFKGRGISYCATCDAPFYKNKIVAVVGGGNAALDAVILLSKFAKKVYLIHRREEFRAEEVRVEQTRTAGNVEMVLNAVVREVKGNKTVCGAVLEDLITHTTREIEVNGIFVEIGHIIESDFVRKLVRLDEHGQIVINQKNETSLTGIFAAGDATTVPYKQIVIAAGEGAKAALSAYAYLQKVK